MSDKLSDKIDCSKALIARFKDSAPMLLCSFGKDSMALLHLIRDTLPNTEQTCHSYPVPIVFHRHPWFPFKNEFADYVISSWDLEVYDYPPLACGIKVNPDRLELVARYPFGCGAIDLPINTEQPLPRRKFACGLEWVLRPKISRLQWKWRAVFIGHKSSDIDPFDGHVPLKDDVAAVGGINLVFPLRHWTDHDVWNYIEANRIPYDKRRYEDRAELPDKWSNSDYLHACTRCIDPRDARELVECPKTGGLIKNQGTKVLRLQQMPDYIAVKE